MFLQAPVVTGLQDTLEIDLEQMQNNSSFHIFNVEDPSNDNVSCSFSKISPSTDALFIEMDGNGI